jgi:hypothetical protein
MHQSSTLDVGMDVHKESIAGASVANDHDAEVVSLGTFGTRPCDIDTLMRKLQAKAQHLVLVSEAGPCGSGLSRSLTKKDDVCWVGAPSLMPTKAGDRVQTDRRDAMHLARLRRSGDRTPVSVPAVDDAASRALSRAREDTLRDLQGAKLRRKACCTIAARPVGPPGVPPRCAGAARWCVPPRRSRSSCRHTSSPLRHRRNGGDVWHANATSRSKPGASRQWSRLSRPCAGASAPWP